MFLLKDKADFISISSPIDKPLLSVSYMSDTDLSSGLKETWAACNKFVAFGLLGSFKLSFFG